jgi:hypothetical protein
MKRIDNVLTRWIKLKLKRRDIELNSDLKRDLDDNIIALIYEEYEERKRLKKIKFSLLFKDNFVEIK